MFGQSAPWALAAVGLQALNVVAQSKSGPIVVDGTSFALNGDNMSYRFHVDNTTGDLITDHFGGSAEEDGISAEIGPIQGWVTRLSRVRREFPDEGRGDFRVPAVKIKQAAGYTVSEFHYQSHEVSQGKPSLKGLPHTFGDDKDVSTLVVHMYDNYSSVAADLSYSIFPKYDAIVRSVEITNKGNGTITVERLASLSVDMPYSKLDMIELAGDWAREAQQVRRKVDLGTQGFGSSTGYSSHLHNPFLALVDPTTTETHGPAWGFSLVYTGSFNVEVDKGSQGLTRATLGFHHRQLDWPLKPNESLVSPEAIAVYSDAGLGGMSRRFHSLFRKHLMKSKYATQTRPNLLNSWEGLYFNINESSVHRLASQAADLGIKLFVLDDGWFANKYPRMNDTAGLGDWEVNNVKFPNGLTPLIDNITEIAVANSSDKLKFGLWFEPEMVNPKSKLYEDHPDWVIHAGSYPRTETRNQLVLNLALPEVQEHVIYSLSRHLSTSRISYVKWDNNRGIHETPGPTLDHKYILGLYKIYQNLTTEFPDVLFEGCASGGGRFDPGTLHWFPQFWTSDNTDAIERVGIQFGTSLVYPPSSMGAHISHVPNWATSRSTPVHFRAHVAMMGGSFGLELNPQDMDEDEKAEIPKILTLAEKINPIVVRGDFYRLASPQDTKYPAAMFISEDGNTAAVFLFQMRATINSAWPWFRMQGLDKSAKYMVNGTQTLSGSTLMNVGIQIRFTNDMDSKLILLEKQ